MISHGAPRPDHARISARGVNPRPRRNRRLQTLNDRQATFAHRGRAVLASLPSVEKSRHVRHFTQHRGGRVAGLRNNGGHTGNRPAEKSTSSGVNRSSAVIHAFESRSIANSLRRRDSSNAAWHNSFAVATVTGQPRIASSHGIPNTPSRRSRNRRRPPAEIRTIARSLREAGK